MTAGPIAGPTTGGPDPSTAGTEPPVPGEPAASTVTDTGGPAGALVTAALVAVLAGAGFWTAYRRRRPNSVEGGR